MSEHKRKVEDAKDRLRSEIDIELRRYRRRLRVAGEEFIAEVTADETKDFDPQDVGLRAVQDAKLAIQKPRRRQLARRAS